MKTLVYLQIGFEIKLKICFLAFRYILINKFAVWIVQFFVAYRDKFIKLCPCALLHLTLFVTQTNRQSTLTEMRKISAQSMKHFS